MSRYDRDVGNDTRVATCCEGTLLAIPGSPLQQCCVNGTIDQAGACCSFPRAVDACGVCGGNAAFVDTAGVCCAGLADAAGRCCDSYVDACGVCGGVDDTCGIEASVVVSLPPPVVCAANVTMRLAADGDVLAQRIAHALSGALEISERDVVVLSVRCASPGATGRLLSLRSSAREAQALVPVIATVLIRQSNAVDAVGTVINPVALSTLTAGVVGSPSRLLSQRALAGLPGSVSPGGGWHCILATTENSRAVTVSLPPV